MNNGPINLSGNGQRGKQLIFTHPPERVISLVPSITESLFELGFGSAVVGITDYCTHPAQALSNLPRLGGPKNPRVDSILALKPDLVAANMEENPLKAVEDLEAAGVKVWVTFPKTIRQSLDTLWLLAGLFQSKPAAIRLETLELTVDWAEAALEDRKPWRYFCPIWQDESGWMTINQHTYVNDVLRIMGGKNVFADREFHSSSQPVHPSGQDGTSQPVVRYPHVTLDEIREANPGTIILPSEPYAFGDTDRIRFESLLPDIPAVQNNRIFCIDGSLITWHGTRLAYALRELPHVFD